jgi:mannitol/fructose-specific phosphotransferase system IIA component (Ntr-type)
LFLTKGLVLSHAKPEDGVNHLDVSMTVFREPVQFLDSYQAKIIITLAVEDQEKHLRILKEIMEVFEDEKRIDSIASIRRTEDILDYLNQYVSD